MKKNYKIVYDNIVFSLQKAGGISGVWRELISRTVRSEEFDCSFLEYSDANNNINRKDIFIQDYNVIVVKNIFLKVKRFLNPTFEYPSNFIFHSSYYRICNSMNAKNVTTVHDFIHERFRSRFLLFINHIQKKRAILKSDAIICVSESTRRDLLYYFPTINIEKVFVVYNGVDREVFKKINILMPENILSLGKYVLFVGNRDQAYKNFNSVVRALKLHPDLNLVLVGGGRPSKKEMANIKKEISGRVYFLSNICNKELNILYNFSFALVYPSLYEGFGMPVIEAQSAGCPVIAMSSSSIPEIAGDAAILVKNGTSLELSHSIHLLKDAAIRSAYIDKGILNSMRFSWDKMANEIAGIYRKVLT
ncbi:MAG: hypothetical protein RL607_1521 [Bacteroidota bacterium]